MNKLQHALYYQYKHLGASNPCLCGRPIGYDSLWEPIVKLSKNLATQSGTTLEFHKDCLLNFINSEHKVADAELTKDKAVSVFKIRADESRAVSVATNKTLSGPALSLYLNGRSWGVVEIDEIKKIVETEPLPCRASLVHVMMGWVFDRECDPRYEPLVRRWSKLPANSKIEDNPTFQLVKRVSDLYNHSLNEYRICFSIEYEGFYQKLVELVRTSPRSAIDSFLWEIRRNEPTKFTFNGLIAFVLDAILDSRLHKQVVELVDQADPQHTMQTRNASAVIRDTLRRMSFNSFDRQRRQVATEFAERLSRCFDSASSSEMHTLGEWMQGSSNHYDFLLAAISGCHLLSQNECGLGEVNKYLTSSSLLLRFLGTALAGKHNV